MSRRGLFLYILIGLIFVPLCFAVALASLIVERPGYTRFLSARVNIGVFRQALDNYKSDVGSFPTSSQGLKALRSNPGVGEWNGPYLPYDLPRDSWGRPYLYRLDELGEPEILSLGGDGKPGGKGNDQDISSLRLDEPIVPLVEEERFRLKLITVTIVAPACGIGYLFLPLMIRRNKLRKTQS